MSQSNTPRRRYLPILLATVLTTATGVGGYVLNLPGESPLSEEVQGDLNAGFASVQGESADEAPSASSLASAWAEDKSTLPAVTPAQSEQSSSDRYAQAILSGDSGQSDQYASAPLPPLEQTPTHEAHAAADTLARGQSPLADQEPLDELPKDNPLREETDPFGSLPSTPPQQTAVAADSRYAPADLSSVGPEPLPDDSGNPLRGQSLPAEQAFADQPLPEQGSFTDARPLAPVNPQQEIAPLQLPPQSYASQGYAGPADHNQLEALSEATSNANSYPSNTNEAEAPAQPSYQSQPTTPIRDTPVDNGFTPVTTGLTSPAIDEGTGRPGESALEGVQRPALVIQKFAPAELQVGKEAKFIVKVRNVGQRPADQVIVSDEVPQGARLVATNPQADVSGGGIQWQLGTLSPGEERAMEMALMPTEEGEIGSVAQVTFASHASAKSRCTRPQLALRMTAPSEVLVGRQQRITIEVHNPGTGDATNVMLLENVPENVRHQSGPALEFEIGTLRAGETRRMELMLTAEKPGEVLNVLTARADGNLQVQQEVAFEVIAPSISVGVDGPSRRYLERPATYTVSVDNPGTAPAKDVQIITKLPKGMRFVRANNLGEYDSATHSVYWSLAELPEGQHGSVELVALPVQSGDQTIEVEGRAREGLEDRTTRDIRVEGLAAIMFEVADAQDPIEVGGSTSYDIRVVNQGSKAATNVQITALVPQGMTVTGASGETRHRVGAEGVVFEPLAQLAPKADTIYKVEVQGVQAGDQRILVEVKTDDITQPIRKEESTRVFGDE